MAGHPRFADCRVLVTGAASGIGRAAARRFTDEGASVIALDVNPAVLELAATLDNGTGVVLDQRNPDQVRRLTAQLGDRIDVLCVNAGSASPPVGFADQPTDRWRRTFDVNVHGTVAIVRAVLPLMQSHVNGSIVFTASTAGLTAYPGNSDYGASKAAVASLSRSLALELAGRGIRVNAVCPGGVRTALIEEVYGDRMERVLAEAAATVPLGKVAEPEDIASVIAFLASADAGFITATCLVVDGGASAMTL